MRGKLLACASAISMAWTVPAYAQNDTSSEEESIIVVTGLKGGAQNVQDVPAAVTALGNEELEARGVTSALDLAAIVPNLRSGMVRGETNISIRGVGYTVAGSSPGVAIHIDGVYQPRATMGELAQVDIGGVEVLRGPQGTLYGRNSNGGVVNFNTTAAGDEFGGYVKASYQNFDEYRMQAAVNIPVSDSLRVRLTGDRWKRGKGMIRNITPGSPDLLQGDSWLGRVRVDADISPEFTATLIGTVATRDGSFFYFTHGTPLGQNALNLNPALAGANFSTNPRETAANDPTDQRRRYYSGTGILNWEVSDDVTLRSTTGYQHFEDDAMGDFDATDVSVAPRLNADNESKTFTQELTASIETGPVRAVLGGFYLNDKSVSQTKFQFPFGLITVGSPAALPPQFFLDNNNVPNKTTSWAMFGDVTLELSDSFRIVGGLRYSEDKNSLQRDNGLKFPNDVFAPFGPRCNDFVSAKFTSWTPKAGIQYDIGADSTTYASFSKGFKSGGFNGNGGCGTNPYRPEKLTSYEIGSKNQFGDLKLNLSGFYYDYKDLQQESLEGLAFVLINVPKAKIYGIEAETLFTPTDNFTINANFAWMRARYVEFSSRDALERPIYTRADLPAPGQPPINIPVPPLENLKGNPLNNAPDFSANVGFTYVTEPIIAGGSLTFQGDLEFKSRVFFREFNDRRDSQAGYALINSSITWTSDNENYSLRLFGKNLTGQDYWSQAVYTSLTDNLIPTWGTPRQYGVELKAKF